MMSPCCRTAGIERDRRRKGRGIAGRPLPILDRAGAVEDDEVRRAVVVEVHHLWRVARCFLGFRGHGLEEAGRCVADAVAQIDTQGRVLGIGGHEIGPAIRVEVPGRDPDGALADRQRQRTSEGAVPVAQQDLEHAVRGVGADQVGPAVAVDIDGGQGKRLAGRSNVRQPLKGAVGVPPAARSGCRSGWR